MKKEQIIKTFSDFMDGYRFIMLIHRNKEGGKSNRPQKDGVKRITKNREEFIEMLDELQRLKAKSKVPMRIYSSVNARDIEKAIKEFRYRQLNADYYDVESKHGFYLDIKNQWVSSLMKQNSRAETKFLIDLDKEEVEKYRFLIDEKLDELKIKVLLRYPTKNGWHVITEPFNPNDLVIPDFDKPFIPEIKKDGLLLLDF